MDDKEINHLAYSILHGSFEQGCGGCSCETCTKIREEIENIAREESSAFYDEHYPPPGGFI